MTRKAEILKVEHPDKKSYVTKKASKCPKDNTPKMMSNNIIEEDTKSDMKR